MSFPDRFVVHFFTAVAVVLVSAAAGYIAFRANFLWPVLCGDTEVKSFIYNHNEAGIFSLEKIEEISFDNVAKLRTCGAQAFSREGMRHITFVIDTSQRGETTPTTELTGLVPLSGGDTIKFSLSYSLQ